jgi:epoxyqueuosine reductase
MNIKNYNFNRLADNIKLWGKELGFSQIGITDLADQRVISCAINYLPNCHSATHISRYALGRNYHKVVRGKLKNLIKKITEQIGEFNYRSAVDSSLVAEKPLAVQAGLGWQGKNSLVINREHGSWMFLGEIVTDLPLPIDKPHKNYCGKCTKCISACPTGAISKAFQIDINRCISFLTIEHRGSIPEELRPLIGKHIYGCDECQLVCPWNRFAKISLETDFQVRHNLDEADLISLFSWSEQEFLAKTEGSAMRRINYECWLRNIAVALGNMEKDDKIIAALKSKLHHPSALVREHVEWALTTISQK